MFNLQLLETNNSLHQPMIPIRRVTFDFVNCSDLELEARCTLHRAGNKFPDPSLVVMLYKRPVTLSSFIRFQKLTDNFENQFISFHCYLAKDTRKCNKFKFLCGKYISKVVNQLA